MKQARTVTVFISGLLLLAFFFVCLLLTGAVDISPSEVVTILGGGATDRQHISTILLETRLPVAVAAIFSGATLSVAGLMMQTLFHNPLAGPSVLGVSSGASFGVALFMLGASGIGGLILSDWLPFVTIIAALGGALITIIILFVFSTVLKSGVTLLIVGLMLGYLFSSGISLLNYFSSADEIRSFMVWGLGSFSGMRFKSSLIMGSVSLTILLPCILFTKPLNAMLLGDRYLESVGYSVKKTRGMLLVLSGILTAVPTAFCGPIAFIGLIVPHVCRLTLRTSNHLLLIPASMLYGAVLTSGCALVGNLPASGGTLPINVITPIIGVPVILYLLIRRNKSFY